MRILSRLLVVALLLLGIVCPAEAVRLFTSGLEENNLTSTATTWTSVTGSAPSLSTTTVHSGTYALRVNPTAAAQGVSRSLQTSLTSGTIFVRFYYQLPAAPILTTFVHQIRNSADAASSYKVEVDSTAQLILTNIVDSTTITCSALSVNTWYRIEIATLISDTVGTHEIRVDGTACGTLTGKDTMTTNITKFNFGTFGGSGTIDNFFDDIAVNDSSGSFQTSWPGLGKIYLLKPDGDVSVTFTPTSGTNASNVDDVPGAIDDATTQTTTSTANNVDRLSLTALGAEVTSDATIILADVYGRVGGDGTSGVRQMRFKLWDEGGALTNGPTTNLNDSASFAFAGTNDHLVYDSTGKTKTNLASFDAGYEDLNAVLCQVTALWINVEWTEAVVGGTYPSRLMLQGVGP